MTLPSAAEIESLHKKYAPNEQVFNEIWQHCQIVQRIALWCIDNAKLANVNRELVEAGSLLHDIGVYKLELNGPLENDMYITHGILGYEILKNEGFDEVLCRFASHHTGVGITAQEIKANHLPLPERDFLAETTEERLVMYADKFHSKGPSQFNSAEWIGRHLGSRFGQEKTRLLDDMRNEFGEPPISQLAASYKQPVR